MFIELFGVFIIISFGESLFSNSKRNIKCLTFHNRPCQAWPTRVNINSNKLFYSFIVSVNKYAESCNTIDYPYAWAYIPNKVKD